MLDPFLSPMENAMNEAQSWTNKFLEEACKHDYSYRALLEEYHTVPYFPQHQAVWDYDVAERVAFRVLAEVVRLSETVKLAKKSDWFTKEQKMELEDAETDMISASKQWVRETAMDPGKARNLSMDLTELFNAKFYSRALEMLRGDNKGHGTERT
ncbi:hypothetical protein CDD83_11119 [Cordyceps sp. RAO-2017]|nr:hypothetical protein CDD83_11119 [Cordyceps sp. RAO-2017]